MGRRRLRVALPRATNAAVIVRREGFMHLFSCSACAIRVYSASRDRERGCPRCHAPMTPVDLVAEMLRRRRTSSAGAPRTARAATRGTQRG